MCNLAQVITSRADRAGLGEGEMQATRTQMTDELRGRTQALLDNKKVGVLSKWNQILEWLLSTKIAYVRKVLISELSVHPLNQNGLGVDAYNVHSTLDKVRDMGADAGKLRQAAAFELRSEPDERDAQLAFMQKLVDAADGMLAKLSGNERLLTVSSSHFSQACRAIKAGCRTPEPKLQDPEGNLNELRICGADEVLKDLINNGWTFVIIFAFVEKLFPTLPDVAQAKLNAEHSAFSMASEVQVMAGMHQVMQHGGSEDDAIAAARSALPPCSDYIHVLADFVTRFADGGSG